MTFPDRQVVEEVRRRYPEGARVRAVRFAWTHAIDDNETVPPGTEGVVRSIDGTGTVHVQWDNGANLGAIHGEDRIEAVDP